jgi:hypothetical protein
VEALLHAGYLIQPSLAPPLHLEDPLLVSGMFEISTVWMSLAELKEAWLVTTAQVKK